MCDRYVLPDQAQTESRFTPVHRWWKFAARFNVAPLQTVPAMRLHERESEGVMMRWGLIPEWAKGETAWLGLHAPSAELLTSRLTGTAWLRGQRCILPCAGFYVWQLTQAKYRQPYFVSVEDEPAFAIAGVWDQSVTEEDDVIEGCAIITVPGDPLPGSMNPRARMPAILRPQDCDAWLHATPAQAHSMLALDLQVRIVAHPVSPRVNWLKYDDPDLIVPAEDATAAAPAAAQRY